jgi:hypothetical protein
MLEIAPSFIIDSGNGLQAFWRLAEGAPKGHVEEVNIVLRDMFNADNCQNIDRLMRVPGFVNFPDEKKRQRGRIPCLSSWHPDCEDNGSIHTLDELRSAFPARRRDQVERVAKQEEADIRLPVNQDELLTADNLALTPDSKLRELIEAPSLTIFLVWQAGHKHTCRIAVDDAGPLLQVLGSASFIVAINIEEDL